jgi:hypothetical protein
MLSSIEYERLSNARSRSNPHESLGRSIFMNRAAIKLANIDAMFSITTTLLQSKVSLLAVG